MLAIQDQFFVLANYAEAVLWFAVGVGFAIAACRRPSRRRAWLVAAAAFIAFGVSDVVEASTGAWWRPWWLLGWKAACVIVFAGLLMGRWKRSGFGSPHGRLITRGFE